MIFAIVLICLFAVNVPSVSMASTNNICSLDKVKPLAEDFNQLKNIANPADYESMAKFDGYLIYDVDGAKKGEAVYLPLTLQEVSFEHDPWETETLYFNTLTLTTDCAKIHLKLDGREVTDIEVDMDLARGSYKRCQIRRPKISFPFGYHYQCSMPITYGCGLESGETIRLTINMLEFEFFADSSTIKNGRYTRPAKECTKLSSYNSLE